MEARLSVDEQCFVLAQIYQAILRYFAHWESSLLPEGDLERAFREVAREALACQGDRRRFGLLLMAFMARLNNGHTRYREPVLEERPPLGMTLRLIEGRWTVTRSGLPGVGPGDLVQGLEGRPVEDWYRELYPYTAGTAHARTVQFAEAWGALFGPLLGIFMPDRYSLTWEDARGQAHALAVDRSAPAPDPAPVRTEGRWLDDDIAYIRVPSFLQPEFEAQALAYVRDFARAGALIVDVRGNGGGNTPARLIRGLMDRPYRWWREAVAVSAPLLAGRSPSPQGAAFAGGPQLVWAPGVSQPDEEGYQGRLLILVDRATWSAAEDFTMPFKDNGRATIVGETTGGSSGQPYICSFEQGMAFAVGAKRLYLPDGTAFEGLGLTPDIAISPTRDDLYAGRDVILKEAIRIARSA